MTVTYGRQIKQQFAVTYRHCLVKIKKGHQLRTFKVKGTGLRVFQHIIKSWKVCVEPSPFFFGRNVVGKRGHERRSLEV